ncbi:MAG TPA: glycosyltransferase [Chryseolinea sp.]
MKILHVINDMDPRMGGVSQAVRSITRGLQNVSNIINEVVSLDSPDAPFLKSESVPVHALGPAIKPWSYSAKLYPWLINNLQRFDVVIIHGLWLYQSYAVRKAILERSKAKTVAGISPRLFVMPHGMLDPYFQRAADRKLKAVRNWIYWKLIESKVINQASGVMFTCEAELMLARQSFRPYHPKRQLNVGLGIDEPPPFNPSMIEAFFNACEGVRNRPYILFLGRIHEKKGVSQLIEAYVKVYTANSPRLVIAGPGLDSIYGQKIWRLVSENDKIKDSVFFPGMLMGEAKWGAFFGCQAFVLPSHQENFGIAVVEALACSKAVLISNQVNIWREIDAKGGGIVENDTVEGTIRLLERWLNLSQEQQLDFRQRAFETYKTYFTVTATSLNWTDSLRITD